MEDWKEYKLGDIGTIVGGATPSTKDSSNYDGNIAWITPKDLSNLNCRYISHGERMISQKGFDDCSCRMLPKNSILFSSRAPIGYVAIAQNALCTNQGFKSIIPNNEIVDSLFLYYLLVYYKPVIENMGSGTTFKEVSGSVMKALTVNIPNIDEQKRIAAILSSLDDKIELNRRINGNLEQQAQALFKAWFVDFEPFKDGKFVDSELGRIPEGWKVGRLDEIGEIVGGGTPSKSKAEYYCNKGIPWVTPKDLSITHAKFTSKGEVDISDLGYKNSSTQILPKGSVLFSSRAPIGYITIALNDICTNQGFKSVIPKIAGTAFIYCYLKNNIKNIESQATGSTFKEASGSLMKSLKVLKPDDISIYRRFEEVETSLFEKQAALEEENLRLSTMRDTLLPQLMSGKLKIDDLNR